MTVLAPSPENAGVSLDGKLSSWMQTNSGGRFYPFNPNPSDINVDDIAHALSNFCRYGGHTRHFYSVAQHSVEGSYLAQEFWGLQEAREFLIHDATEAYIGDMIRPMKVYLPQFYEIEEGVWNVIADHFNIKRDLGPEIKWLDNVMCMWEKRDLLNHDEEWQGMPDITKLNLPELFAWSPVLAKEHFLVRFNELFE